MSDHQKLNVPSEEMAVLKQVLLHTLSVFHQFSCENNIDYSLIAGSLIGYYGNGDMLPWDDDIDIEMHPKDVIKLLDLWENGETPENIMGYETGFNNEYTKIVELGDEEFEMMVSSLNFQKKEEFLIKLRPVNHNCFHDVPGGLDITTVYTNKEGKPTDAWDLGVGIDPEFMDSVNSPVIVFGTVSARAVKFDIGENYLLNKYGKKWCIKKHPTIK